MAAHALQIRRSAAPRARRAPALFLAVFLGVAGGAACTTGTHGQGPPAAAKDREPAHDVLVSVIGTNDLHGRLDSLPWLGGHVRNLRAARAADGGGVLLVDAGDLFQGTLASNLGEGADVVRAYEALGYAAVAVGNHEFDFGPAGPAASAEGPDDDPRGALKARLRQARFPFLAANLVEEDSGLMPGWQNLRPSTTVEVAGLPIGLVGVTTRATPRSTLPSNFAGLAVTALEEAIVREARRLRAEGVRAVVVLAHEGGRCREFRDPEDLSSCEAGSEIFEVARRLPAGLVDVIVAGHTHQGIAHVVNGVAIVESFAEGRAFGRVDLVFDGRTRRVRALRVHPPRPLCGPGRPARGRGGGLRAAAVRGRARRSGRRHRRPGRPGA